MVSRVRYSFEQVRGLVKEDNEIHIIGNGKNEIVFFVLFKFVDCLIAKVFFIL
jgi:hypothetical protein